MTVLALPLNDRDYMERQAPTLRFSATGSLSINKTVNNTFDSDSQIIACEPESLSQKVESNVFSSIYNLVLRSYSELAENEEETVQLDAIPIFLELLERPLFQKFEEPDVSIDPDGEINAEWLGEDGQSFTFSVGGKGRIIFSLYLPQGRKLCGETRIEDDLEIFEDFIRSAIG